MQKFPRSQYTLKYYLTIAKKVCCIYNLLILNTSASFLFVVQFHNQYKPCGSHQVPRGGPRHKVPGKKK